ncbi:MAG: glycosyltransferase [Planctomycetota bacterium]
MRIAMFTNTYLPQVGGVAYSVDRLTRAFRSRGHRVLVVAPRHDEQPEDEEDVLRTPAIQNFNGSDFAVALPAHPGLAEAMDAFRPQIIHSHHPFLLGTTALREAAARQVPIVFTHHSRYEFFTSYVPVELPPMRACAIKLTLGYANLCDAVVAPSESIRELLEQRGVETEVRVIPTGLDLGAFAEGDGAACRRRQGVPQEAFVIGHVGRLGPEKNLGFLGEAVAAALEAIPAGHFLVVGSGSARETMAARLAPVRDRVHFAGTLTGKDLYDAYHALDVFVFASTCETQGVVVAEALAAGRPVVALDGPGVREVVKDGRNGRLLTEADAGGFADAIAWARDESRKRGDELVRQARASVEPFSEERCADAALALYRDVRAAGHEVVDVDRTLQPLLRSIRYEWDIWANRLKAAADAFGGEHAEPSDG